MKQIEKLQAKARQRFGFCGSLIIHFILFVALAFSGVFAMQPPAADADTVVFFDAGGGGEGGGGDEAVADAAEDGEEQVEDVVEEETITLPDGKIEHKQVVKHVVKHVPAGGKKGSSGGHGTGHGTGSGSGSGSGNGSGEGRGVPVKPPRLLREVAPVYPASARNSGATGVVTVRILVGADGSVEDVTVVGSSGNGAMDNSVVTAVNKWRFSPAKDKYGQNARCRVTRAVSFNLR